jgi:hypothetical protein
MFHVFFVFFYLMLLNLVIFVLLYVDVSLKCSNFFIFDDLGQILQFGEIYLKKNKKMCKKINFVQNQIFYWFCFASR